MEENAKPFWASKTLWVNVIALVAVIVAAFWPDFNLDAELQASLVGGIMAIVNIVLRITTKTAVTMALWAVMLIPPVLVVVGCGHGGPIFVPS